MKKLLFILFFLLNQLTVAQLLSRSFEEIDTLTIKKPIVVFLHTEWCKACKIMKSKTFNNQEVIEKLNSEYYFVSFDAENEKDIYFKNRSFKSSNSKKGIHELAVYLGKYKGKIKYPTTIVLSKENEIVFQRPSVLLPKNLIRLLEALEIHEKL